MIIQKLLPYNDRMTSKEVEALIPQRANETQKQYHGRKVVFVKVMRKSNGNVGLAIKFSNIWANTEFMKCTYDERLMQELRSYL